MAALPARVLARVLRTTSSVPALRRLSAPILVGGAAAACTPAAVPPTPAPARTVAPVPGPVASTPPSSEPAFRYPAARRDAVVDEYHGVRVEDPYRWLEDVDSPETRAWIEAENALTFGFLKAIPERAAIERRLTELWNYERYGVPERAGQRLFYTKNDGLQNQPVLYVVDRPSGAPRVLLDPNALSADGTVALTGLAPRSDGKLVAYALSSAGSDWTEWRVRDVAKGTDLPDEIRWTKFTAAEWTHDGRGFFYSRFPEPEAGASREATNYDEKLYYHRLGTAQADDLLVYERPDHRDWTFEGKVTDDGKFLIVTVAKSTDEKYLVYYEDLKRGVRPGALEPLVDRFEAEYSFVGSRGSRLWFKTNLGAPRGRIVAVDVRGPERSAWKEIVPEDAAALQSAHWIGDRLVLSYLVDAHGDVRVFDADGRSTARLALPGLGTVRGFSGKQSDRETFFLYTSFTTPPAIYRYAPSKNQATPFLVPRVAFEPSRFTAEQVFVTSKDGTRVPLYLVKRAGYAPDGATPTYLYGYGGFNISITPSFEPAALEWLEMGGLYAVANLRGGGEYGREWHEAGTKERKQNVFDDFIAAAEWLVANGYTRTEKLAIGGRSNGGLLVGACLTERPDLFGAALPAVGVLDMLRYHKHTIGWEWADDYGTSDDPNEFRALLAYSPLHNVRPGTRYPATLVTTADHDDRVVPSHSFKFAAALQAAQAGPRPVLIRIETRAGHGAGTPTRKLIEEQADRWAFLVKELGMVVQSAP